MIVRYGAVVPEGWLPVFAVASPEEAKYLLTLACQTNARGEFIARELAEEQTLDNLFAFGDRLAEVHDKYVLGKSRCGCKEVKEKS